MTQMNRAPASPSVAAKPGDWFGRHKKLAIPLGCVGLLVVASLLLGATVLTIAVAALRSSDAYRLALTAATHDPAVAAALGPPVRAGWLTTGRVTVSGPSGDASLAIPVSGSRGSGTLHVSAQKSGGRWTFSVLDVSVSGRPTPIDLLPKSP
jgi:hypothetical protein